MCCWPARRKTKENAIETAEDNLTVTGHLSKTVDSFQTGNIRCAPLKNRCSYPHDVATDPIAHGHLVPHGPIGFMVHDAQWVGHVARQSV